MSKITSHNIASLIEKPDLIFTPLLISPVCGIVHPEARCMCFAISPAICSLFLLTCMPKYRSYVAVVACGRPLVNLSTDLHVICISLENRDTMLCAIRNFPTTLATFRPSSNLSVTVIQTSCTGLSVGQIRLKQQIDVVRTDGHRAIAFAEISEPLHTACFIPFYNFHRTSC